MTHSSWLVGLSVTLTGGAMFIGLMVGGVLADRYERKKLILLARGTCGVGFIGLCLNAMLPEPSLIAIYALGLWDGFFTLLGDGASCGNARAGRAREPDAGGGDYHAHRASGLGDFADGGRPAAGDRQRGVELRAGGGGNLHHHADRRCVRRCCRLRRSRASIR